MMEGVGLLIFSSASTWDVEAQRGQALLKVMPKVIKPRNCGYRSVVRSCLTLCDPMDCSPPGSSVYGISHAGILK